MKRALLFFAFAAMMIVIQAKPLKITQHSPAMTIAIDKPDTNKTKIYTAVEQEPGFKGGMDKFIAFLERNLKYPVDAEKNRVQGKVYITFVVEKDGKLSDIKVVRSVSRTIDAEAVRVIGMSPKWNPGIQNNRPVKVQFTIPINFVLPQPNQVAIDTSRVFTVVEQDPSFPGGNEAFARFIKNNLRYPEEAKKNRFHGMVVYIDFIVERNGSLLYQKITKSVSPEIDAEAIRLIKECPSWNPGRIQGTPVRVVCNMPIHFELPE